MNLLLRFLRFLRFNNQWIGLRENLHQTMVFTMKFMGFTMKCSPKPIHNQSWNNLNEFSGSTWLSLKESDENLNDNKNNHNDDKANISNEIGWW